MGGYCVAAVHLNWNFCTQQDHSAGHTSDDDPIDLQEGSEEAWQRASAQSSPQSHPVLSPGGFSPVDSLAGGIREVGGHLACCQDLLDPGNGIGCGLLNAPS